MLHDDSHLGIDHCIQRAKGSVYWPGITEDIKSIMNKCEKCLSHGRYNQKELNGPCYRSQEFNLFCNKFEIKHVAGAANNHQANAIAER